MRRAERLLIVGTITTIAGGWIISIVKGHIPLAIWGVYVVVIFGAAMIEAQDRLDEIRDNTEEMKKQGEELGKRLERIEKRLDDLGLGMRHMEH